MIGKISAFLFDLDGTLADTATANYEAYSKALSEVGVIIDRAAFDMVASGRNWHEFVPVLLRSASVEVDAGAIAERKHDLYRETIGALPLNEPLLSLLMAVRPKLRTALVTTASRGSVAAILEHHKLTDLFEVIVTGDDVARHKPHPEAYLLAATRLGVVPAECLVFEDSEIGVASARAAGAHVLRVSF